MGTEDWSELLAKALPAAQTYNIQAEARQSQGGGRAGLYPGQARACVLYTANRAKTAEGFSPLANG